MSKLYVDELHPKTSGNKFIIPPAGGIIQTQYTQFTGTSTTTTNSQTDVALSDLTVNITPVSTSSKIKIEVDVAFEGTVSDHNYLFFLYRDSTILKAPTDGSRSSGLRVSNSGYHADDSGSTPALACYNYYDEPSTTSQITYKVGVRLNSTANGSLYLNRTKDDLNSAGYERLISSITVTEIAG